MGLSAVAIASIAGAVAAVSGTAYNIKQGEQQRGEASSAKKRAKSEAQKKKDLLAKTKEKSPGQRLLGGRPTLG